MPTGSRWAQTFFFTGTLPYTFVDQPCIRGEIHSYLSWGAEPRDRVAEGTVPGQCKPKSWLCKNKIRER